MDILIPALVLVVLSIVGLTFLKVPPKKKPDDPAPVKCPKCSEGRTLKDILCPNCGNKTLKPSNPAGSFACDKCNTPQPKLPCPKCGCDLARLPIK